MGIIYGKLATVDHRYLPPNWLADMIGVHDVETRIDLAYASLNVDAALLGAVLSIIIRLKYRHRRYGVARPAKVKLSPVDSLDQP
jgi:hypothetical protein